MVHSIGQPHRHPLGMRGGRGVPCPWWLRSLRHGWDTPVGIVVAILLGLAHSMGAAAPLPDTVRFNQHIRPILSNHCFYCHGPDPKHRQADLRLDTREGATADLGGYAAIVPGKPEESVLLARVTSTDPAECMPPRDSKKPHLTAEQIALLRRWIEQGAPYEPHWAFLPLAEVKPPPVRQSAWVRNPIDAFVLARLEAEGIAPSPEAEPAVLIRRLSLDLTGLLPAPDEVDRFVRGEESYEALVDRLLASPRYGERWGRHWLDQARYADSNGYSIDSERAMWPYRDWVIKAHNDDLPFDQFTIEQIAGDLLPSPTKNQLVATAFHRNTLINEEGGTDPQQFRHEAVVDRVNTTGAVWLGLTIGCCQCHSHKFDPISIEEFYRLFAFFNNTTDVNNAGATIPVSRGEVFGVPLVPPPAEETPQQRAERQAAWEKQELARLEGAAADKEKVQWVPLEYREYSTRSGTPLKLLDDRSLLLDGPPAAQDRYRVVARSPLTEIAALRLRVLTHPSLPRQGPGTAANGNFVLTDLNLITTGQKRPFASAFADHEQPGYPVRGAIDEDAKSGWAINVAPGSRAKMNAPHEAIFILDKPIFVPPDQTVEVTLSHEANAHYLIGRFALEVAAEAPSEPVPYDPALLEALTTPASQRSSEQQKLVAEAFERSQQQVQMRRREDPRGDTVRLMIMKELEQPRPTYVCIRGDFLRPDKDHGVLVPDVPQVIPPRLPPAQQRTRLDLARWLVDPANPLTPRVTVNRVWMRYFGRGLVETEEDFGTQGTPPTHPELLDWLAGEFIRRGWSLKALHRLIVTSSTYRQSSSFREDLRQRDPRNLLLARQERLRVEAEIVRDAALCASGLLDSTIGGPSVRPPQPEGVYAFTQTVKKWVADTGASRYRRGMYTLFFRSAPHPLLSTFDVPDMQSVCTRRGRSNTPLQALLVANDEAMFECAQALAARVLAALPDAPAEEHLAMLVKLALCRPPQPEEHALLRAYYDRQLARLAQAQEQAAALVTTELARLADPPKAAALVLVSRVILNCDNFLTRE